MDVRTLARADTDHGEVVLRERDTANGRVHELIVNGVFAMDSVDTTSERLLAECVPVARRRILVGGLGLGYTSARLIDLGAAVIRVVEQAEPLIGWARQGLTPTLAAVAAHPRVALVAGRIQDELAQRQPCWDVILLDVDNGPTFLVLADNAALYQTGVEDAWESLAPGGELVIWCESPTPTLLERLRRLDPRARERLVPIRREGRSFTYALYLVRR